MLEVSAALEVVLAHTRALSARATMLSYTELGQITAADVRADRDSPPFDKSLRDGYALRAADAGCELKVIEEIPAGAMPTKTVEAGECSRIFTGAPLPEGADAVVMQEDTSKVDSTRIRVTQAKVAAGQWIFRRGQEMPAGDIVVPRGTVLSPAVIGLLANVGCTRPELVPVPRVAVLATGDELVPPDQAPGPGQIRNSNGPMLVAQIHKAGAIASNLGIARDTLDKLRAAVDGALADAHVLILAGGVSVGDYDLVPKVLEEFGVITHVRQVRMKPGKPMLFGTHDGTGTRKLIFGLPGNPVSAYVSFELFVRPALRKLMGHADVEPPRSSLPLMEPLMQKNDRPTFHPARVEPTASGLAIRALPWGGAPDLRGLLDANALLELPAGEVRYQLGDVMTVIAIS